MKFKNIVDISLIAFLPTIAYANGGGPLLLFMSGGAFIFGQVWILLVETMVLKKFSGFNTVVAFKQVLYANLLSTVIVGLGFPFLLAVITAFAMQFSQPYGGYASAIGTWAYYNAPYMQYLGYTSLAWLLITFLLTMFCEKKFYKWYWVKIDFNPNFPVTKFIWIAHVLSYAGLLIIVVVIWHDLFGI